MRRSSRSTFHVPDLEHFNDKIAQAKSELAQQRADVRRRHLVHRDLLAGGLVDAGQ